MPIGIAQKVILATEGSVSYSYNTFGDAGNWDEYNPSTNGVGTNADGYIGVVFDGRYVYFVPYHNGSSYHGEVLRYDTTTSFSNAASWDAYDPGTNGVGTDPDGYAGGIFDGRYVYFSANYNGSNYHAEVMRYDTQGSFTSASSWETYTYSSAQGGYFGVEYDGRYVYFVPTGNRPAEVLRYDTSGGFSVAGSWDVYTPSGANGGYSGAVFDGQYVYFVPAYDGSYHGEVLRYDTTGGFTTAGSWSTYDPGSNGVGSDPDGYEGAVYDGQYIYFSPIYNGTASSGEVMRYDTTGGFTTAGSWSTYDPNADGVGTNPVRFSGAVYDGRYVYFVPYQLGDNTNAEFMRYDTEAGFSTAGSWETYTPGANGVGTGGVGFRAGGFDGRYIYFSCGNLGCDKVMRFDAKTPPLVPNTVYGGSYF